MADRTTHHAETPLNLKGQSLLVGNIYCGHCRNRLTLTTSGRKRINKHGELVREVRARYQCHYNVRHPGECDGQSGYGVKKLDGIVEQIVRYQLSRISAASGAEIVTKQNEKAIELAKARYNAASTRLADKQEIQTLTATVDAAQQELEQHLASSDVEMQEYERIKSWADLYDTCTFYEKKMIISQFIKSVYVYRDYTLEIEFNVSFEDFKTMATECQEQGRNKDPLVYVTA